MHFVRGFTRSADTGGLAAGVDIPKTVADTDAAVVISHQAADIVITADLSYVTASYLPWTRSFTLDIDNDVYDVTAFSTSSADVQWRSYVGGLSDWTADLGSIVPSGPATTGYTPLWFDHLNTDTDLIVELHVASTYKWEGYATIEGNSYTAQIDALQEETVTLKSASALYYATTE